MAIENKFSNFLNKRKEIIPILFAFMCVCLIASLIGVELKGLANMDHFQTFNTGGEIAAIFAGVMITLSILPSYKRQSGYTRVFVTLIAALCFLMTCDLAEALVDNTPSLIWLNNWLVRIPCIVVWFKWL